jgi:F-type H+-transporting ATPase subunit delta
MKKGTLTLAKRYALALIRMTENSGVKREELETQFQEIQAFLVVNPKLAQTLQLPQLTFEEKMDLLKEVEKSISLTEQVKKFLATLTKRNRWNVSDLIFDTMIAILQKNRGIERITVKSAVQLSSEEQKDFVAKLESATGKKYVAKFEFDSKLIAGMVFMHEGNVFDVSLQEQLRKMKASLEEVRV